MGEGLSLVMPMAGRGSRFASDGHVMPKPLIDLGGKPFFWWAIESIARHTPLRELVAVVLRAHIEQHDIEARILHHYPQANIVVLDEVTAGAAETAALGIAALRHDGPFAVNDCDHAFRLTDLDGLVAELRDGAEGGLVGFRSDSPAYSYIRFDDSTPPRVTGTIEKVVAGPYAIAGCYLFADRKRFADRYAAYRDACPYDELFVSGLFDMMCADGQRVAFRPLARHLSFGTPEELERVTADDMAMLWDDGSP
jgi:NDP-sugar pyrophosphorylase family protein